MSGQGKKDRLQQKSPAEFFADNKNIAGFDNVRRIDLLTRFQLCLHFEIDRFVFFKNQNSGFTSLASCINLYYQYHYLIELESFWSSAAGEMLVHNNSRAGGELVGLC